MCNVEMQWNVKKKIKINVIREMLMQNTRRSKKYVKICFVDRIMDSLLKSFVIKQIKTTKYAGKG